MTRRRPLACLALAASLLAACGSAIPAAHHVEAPLGPVGGRFRVLAPPPSAGGGPFPVVYFLHDLWGSDAVLWEHGVAQRLLARMASGELPPFLLVAPEGDRGFWCDSWDGKRQYERWLGDGLPAAVAAAFPVLPGRAGRAWVGISMGGLGAVRQGLREPSEAGAIASISGLVIPLGRSLVDDANPLMRRVLGRVFGHGFEEPIRRHNDPVLLLDTLAGVPAGERPRLLLLGGRDDKYRLGEAAAAYAGLARAKGLQVELEVTGGGHDWAYWRGAAEQAIAWAARTLAATRHEPVPPAAAGAGR